MRGGLEGVGRRCRAIRLAGADLIGRLIAAVAVRHAVERST